MQKYEDKPWLKNYPAGVPEKIEAHADAFPSLATMIEYTCERYAALPAFSNMGQVMTFAEIEQQSRRMAAYFQSVNGLKKGDRIVIQMPNLLQYPVALFGAIRAGLVVVNTNPLYTPEEMQRNFKDSGAVAIVILENFADKLETILAQTSITHVILTEIGDLFPFPKRTVTNLAVKYLKKMVPRHSLKNTVRFRDALAQGAAQLNTFKAPKLTHEDLVFLQYTGGTTGVSKAAALTHGNLLANLFQMLAWLKVMLKEGDETIIAALPLYHVFCLTVNCFGLFANGNHNVLITNPRDIPDFIKTLSKVKPTVITAVSTLIAGLLNHPRFKDFDPSSLKVTVAGGMALKGSVAEEWRTRTKTLVVEGYGLTEASPVVTCNPLDAKDRLGTIGMPLPSTEVCIFDEANQLVPVGEPGELCVRGPQVMRGYWNQPAETKHVLDAQGWLHTGDIALMEPDGFFKIVDRKKDMILVSGFNVYPNEVEEIVMRHPKVLDCAAIGVPDEHSGEVVKIFVVKRDPSLTDKEILDYCHKNFTGYKRPKHVEFKKELPKNNVGKILRRELR
jgi:long-chain acyl-CoA synthetase